MADIKWTEGQQKAIDHSDGSMIVTAAAGSGKTAVIVARVLRIIKTCDIDKLIIVTFTNATAAQMREKIAEGLTEAIADENTSREDKINYQKQLLLLPSANVCTMHSFCMRLLKENFDKLEIPSSFDLCDDANKKIIFREALEELFEECYQEEAFKDFAEKFVTSKSDKIEEYTGQLFNASRKSPFPEKWLDMVEKSYEDYKNSYWYSFYLDDIKLKLVEAVKQYRESVIRYVEGIEDFPEATALVESDTLQFMAITEESTYSQLYDVLNKPVFDRLPAAINKKDPEKVMSGARDAFKKLVGKIKPELSEEELEAFMKEQTKNIKMLISLVKRLDEKYKDKKLQASKLEYDDLEHYAIKLLCDEDGKPTSLAKELSKEYEEIIIDEYQDTNDIQETIFNAISKNGQNLFMVGDMKQSIYSFRNTAPELFVNKAKLYSKGQGGTRSVLSHNFRSRKNILDFVNFVFENIMSIQAGEVEYDQDERLNLGNKNYNCDDDSSVDIYVTEKIDGISKLEVQTAKIAEIIEDVIENQYVTEKNGERRRAKYSDICVLTRKSTEPIPKMANILTKMGIPVFSNTKGGMFLETYEVSLILAFLKILDNPYQDIPLVTVLRSPVYNISDHILTQVSKNGKGSFYEKLLRSKEEIKELSFFFNDFNTLKNMCRIAKCGEIVGYILNNMGVMDFIANMPGGDQRRLNLEYIKKYAREFEADVKRSVYEFVSYIGEMSRISGDVNAPKYMPEGVEAVTLMSMHSSKGLEYPVVIIAGLEGSLAGKSPDTDARVEKNLGFGFSLMDAENFRKISSPVSDAIDRYLKQKLVSEEMRILYVAMTRAKEKLILVGTAEDKDLIKDISSGVFFREAVAPEYVKKAESMLSFVLMGCAKLEDFNTNPYTEEGITPHKVQKGIKFTFKRQSFEQFEEEAEENTEEKEFQATENKEVNRRLEYEYDLSGRYYTKYSVSDLKKLEGEEINPYFEKLSPLFEEEISGAERGTSIHKIFEEIDATKVTDIDSIREYVKDVPADEIYGFYASEIGERLKKSNEIYKEEPFIISENDILIQGVIDCYFKDGDKYVIVDFKSDVITPSNREARIDMYKIQLEYYKKAVKKIHNTENVESYLYFTKLKETKKI